MKNQEEQRYFEVTGTIAKTWFDTRSNFDPNEPPTIEFYMSFSFNVKNEEKEETLSWMVNETPHVVCAKEDYPQLCNLSKLLDAPTPNSLIGKKVRLIFGQVPCISDETCIGIGEEDGNCFIIPSYLFSSELKREDKQFFYSKEEVLKVLSKLQTQ